MVADTFLTEHFAAAFDANRRWFWFDTGTKSVFNKNFALFK